MEFGFIFESGYLYHTLYVCYKTYSQYNYAAEPI